MAGSIPAPHRLGSHAFPHLVTMMISHSVAELPLHGMYTQKLPGSGSSLTYILGVSWSLWLQSTATQWLFSYISEETWGGLISAILMVLQAWPMKM